MAPVELLKGKIVSDITYVISGYCILVIGAAFIHISIIPLMNQVLNSNSKNEKEREKN